MVKRTKPTTTTLNIDEIQDERIKVWYSKLPDEKIYSPLTENQEKYLKAFMSPSSNTYGKPSASAKKALGYLNPPALTKQKVNRYCNKHYRGYWKGTGKVPVQKDEAQKVEKPELVDLSKNVLKKALTQEENLALAQDTAKFVLKSTKEFAEKQDMSATASIAGLNISFSSFRKQEKIEEAEIVEPKQLDGQNVDSNKIKRVK